MKLQNELLEKIRSIKLCLMAHPDNEQGSEFEDRINDLIEIEESLKNLPTKANVSTSTDIEVGNIVKYLPEVQKIHHQFGVSEKANYEIQKLFDKLILEDRAEQLRLGAVVGRSEQLKAFVDEFIEAWEDGDGGDSDLYRKAKSL